jgi:long-chain acyl-CoA synthetase
MEITDKLDLKLAPREVFDQLDDRADEARFMVPSDATASSNDEEAWEPVTWQTFADQIRRAALYLREETALEPGGRSAIFAPNRLEWMSAALGIQAAGGVMVPIYASSTWDHAAYVIDHSDTDVLFVDTAPLLKRVLRGWDAYNSVDTIVLLDDIDAAGILDDLAVHKEVDADQLPAEQTLDDRLVTWETLQQRGGEIHESQPDRFRRRLDSVYLDDPGLMLYTSGTTGDPKGVPLTHRNSAANGRDWIICNAPMIPEDGIDLCWLPFSHVFGFGEICLGNTMGLTTYLRNPGDGLEQMQSVRPHVFMSIPRYWEKLAVRAQQHADDRADQLERLHKITGGRLEFCLSGGAGLKREIKEFFNDAGMLVIEGYGLTEASPTLTMNRRTDYDFDTVGKPFPSVDLKLDEDGEILAKGPNVFNGYHDNPDATAQAFTDDGWLRTGDIGEWTDDGFLKVVDRKKEILVTAGGKNVSPTHIEEQFADDPYIEHLVVYGDGEKFLVAGVWLDDDAVEEWVGEQDGDRRDLVEQRVAAANDHLASYETVKKFRIFDEPLSVDDGHLTPTLKIKRSEIYEDFGDELAALY